MVDRRWRADGITLGITDYAPHRVMPAHAHDSLGISVVLRGFVEETAGGTTEIAGVASAVIKPAGTVHANRFGPEGARLLAIDITAGRAAELLDAPGCLDRWRWVQVMRALGVATRALADLSSTSPPPDDVIGNLAVELVAALDGDTAAAGGTAPAWLWQVRDRLHDEFGRPCRVRDLASGAGVHPIYLARRFRQHFGTSVLEYLRAVRVRAAVRSLADADLPIAEVAVTAGFADQSHLTRVLRAATGLTPGGYRALARSA